MEEVHKHLRVRKENNDIVCVVRCVKCFQRFIFFIVTKLIRMCSFD